MPEAAHSGTNQRAKRPLFVSRLPVLLRKRKQKLAEFERALRTNNKEGWWQDFFEANKWIFGYGLDYHILRQEEAQPTFGGAGVDGAGDQIGDFLESTVGDINFTVLVEIKTPSTPLLQGNSECRSGTWSLSRDLTDALAQIQTNIHRWELRGAGGAYAHAIPQRRTPNSGQRN